jgi:hypothetical protein
MTKQEYFKMVREINNELRANGANWFQTYSEPRKKTSYRTKLYEIDYVKGCPVSNGRDAELFVERASNGLLKAESKVGCSQYGYATLNLIITPTNLLEQ